MGTGVQKEMSEKTAVDLLQERIELREKIVQARLKLRSAQNVLNLTFSSMMFGLLQSRPDLEPHVHELSVQNNEGYNNLRGEVDAAYGELLHLEAEMEMLNDSIEIAKIKEGLWTNLSE
jgi:hypothetical protein